jgi:DNA-binding response OmpR family regulator
MPLAAATSPAPRILMIEDDHRLAAMVASYLSKHGFTVDICEAAHSGMAALHAAAASAPFALVLLDLMLPDADGLEVCRSIRALPAPAGSTPVMMLTAKGDPMDRIVGLELGADDYLGKPFEPRELLARVRSLLRRNPAPAGAVAVVRTLHFGRLDIDLDARALRIDGQARIVTAYQFDLLVVLAEHAGRVLAREQLMELVRREPLDAFDRSIDVHVGRLRAVIEDDPKQPKRILTVRGAGYVFAKLQDG